MFAITGITGQVGGVVARTLLAAGKNVRAVVRDAAKGEAWARQGCEVALAPMDDPDALRSAFAGTEGEGWITFEHDAVKGRVELQTVLRGIIERASWGTAKRTARNIGWLTSIDDPRE